MLNYAYKERVMMKKAPARNNLQNKISPVRSRNNQSCVSGSDFLSLAGRLIGLSLFRRAYERTVLPQDGV